MCIRDSAGRTSAALNSLSESQKRSHAEALFKCGLADLCPRCGFAPDSKSAEDADFEAREEHLRECTDAAAHAEWRKKQRKEAEAKEAREAGKRADDEVMNAAAWRAIGGGAESAWMLTDKNLEAQCEQRGLETDGGREAQLARLSEAMRGEGGAPMLTEASAPTNLHALSLKELRSVLSLIHI